jgi:hypothetical protein
VSGSGPRCPAPRLAAPFSIKRDDHPTQPSEDRLGIAEAAALLPFKRKRFKLYVKRES